MFFPSSFLAVAIASLVSTATAAPPALPSIAVLKLRIEGLNSTIYEGPIATYGHNVTTASSGNVSFHCDGTNYHVNPTPGPTATSALDDAAHLAQFTWDGNAWTKYDDIFITRIGKDTNNTSQFWGILLGYQYTSVGGCQQRVKNGDDLLFAFDAFSKDYFLKLEAPLVAKVGVPVQFNVTDGMSGVVVGGAVVGGQTSDAEGHVTLTFDKPGVHTFKAEQTNAIRSNAVVIAVSP